MSNFANIPEKDFDEMFDSNFIYIGQFHEELEKFYPELSDRLNEIHQSLSERDQFKILRRTYEEKCVDILVDCKAEDAKFLDEIQEMYVRWCQQKYIEYNLTKSGEMC